MDVTGTLAAFLTLREWWKFVPDEAIIASNPGSGAAQSGGQIHRGR